MLIIFDLDDTLVDTSGCLIPVKLRQTLDVLTEKGLSISSYEEALEFLYRLNTTASSSKEAIQKFLSSLQAPPEFLALALEEIDRPVPKDTLLYPQEGALDLLQELVTEHKLALVTVGQSDIQFEKLEKAGIDSTIFSKIFVSKERDKKVHYETLLDLFGYSPQEVLVCGDRIGIDLKPAKELGCCTVHLRKGRGLNEQLGAGAVDFTITHLQELKNIIHSFKRKV